MNAEVHPLPPPARPHGSVAVPFAIALPVMLGFMGMAIDVSMLYLRTAEMQQLADATAVAAAHELDGTLAGVQLAKSKATAIAEQMYYGGPYRSPPTTFSESNGTWSTSAIFLSSSLTSPVWVPADSVASDTDAATLVYVKVDTGELAKLGGNPGFISTTLLRAINGTPNSVTAAPVAVAGRIAMQVTPLGVCALSTTKFDARQAMPVAPLTSIAPELVEYGFRRGVTYNLTDLNTTGSTGQGFLVDPIESGSEPVSSDAFSNNKLKPFFCAGMVAYGDMLPGSTVHVASLSGTDVSPWLNSRLDIWSGDACVARQSAPPDTNVKEYLPPYTWMPTLTNNRAATSTNTISGQRETYADVYVNVVGKVQNYVGDVKAVDFGPLWTAYKPAKFVSGSSTGTATPPSYFGPGEWQSLYPVSSNPKVPNPTTAPYIYPINTPSRTYTQSPSSGYKHAGRRILNVPLLDCSGTVTSTATVLGIGSFYMTSRATSTAVYGEFGGLSTSAKTLTTNVARIQ